MEAGSSLTFHNSPPLAPIPSQMKPFHALSYFFKIHFSIIVPSTPSSSEGSLQYQLYMIEISWGNTAHKTENADENLTWADPPSSRDFK
jgi:hypothetical protein